MLHSEDLFEQVRQASEEGRQNLQSPDCVVSEQTFSAALQAVGSVLEAVEEVAERRLDNAFCAVRPPGHHAERDQAMGFCFFNNIALAAEYLTRNLGYKRVLIFDFDVHHGNGTQDLLWNEPRALTITSHQMPLWPGTGRPEERGKYDNVLNLPLPPNSDGSYMRSIYREKVFPKIRSFRPDLILLSAGFDAHIDDPLAELKWEVDDFAWITREVCNLATDFCSSRVVSILEGGYNLDALAACTKAHIENLIEAN